MSSKNPFNIIKLALPYCNEIPESAKQLLQAVDSLIDLNENETKKLWNLLYVFLRDSLISNKDTTEDTNKIASYQFILDLSHHIIINSDDINHVYENEELIKILLLLQNLYTKQYKTKFKMEIIKMCLSFWKLNTAAAQDNTKIPQTDDFLNFNGVVAKNIEPTFNYLFETIKVTTKKCDMKILSTLLWEFCKDLSSLSSNRDILSFIVHNLEKIMKSPMFLGTETGKLIIAEVYTVNHQLFKRYHQIVKQNLPSAKKIEAEAYGEIYFIGWINSNASMKESEFRVVRCNAIEILTVVYPLEKRGEGRENSSRFLIKQQNAFLKLMEDNCPQVRIAALKGICCCLTYFWNTFEEECLNQCFTLFARLLEDSVFEVRQVIFYGFCQLLEESKCFNYFKTPVFKTKLKKVLNDENEKVRRAFIHFLLKVKKVDSIPENENKINFASIVNLSDIARALESEIKPNCKLFIDLIFDNFIGDRVPDRNATLMRLIMFYKLNPTACRKLMIFSKSKLDFSNATSLILSLLKTIYMIFKKKEGKIIDTTKENLSSEIDGSISDNEMDIYNSTKNSSNCSENLESNQDEQTKVCCILDCVSCLMMVHHETFMEENNQTQYKDVQSSCVSCLIKLLKFYKEGDAYFSAINLASLLPVSKLSSHVSVSSSLLSTLKKLPYDMKNSKEEVDMRKVNCLVYTLCMWKRGYEILQCVTIWFDEAFRSLDLNESQYPEVDVNEKKRVRFKIDVDECKPMTGILLVNSILNNLQTQSQLIESDINKKNIYDLFVYLKRIKMAIEKRISSNNVLDNYLLSDEVLIELFKLHIRLHVVYQSNKGESGKKDTIQYQLSIFNWILSDLIVQNWYEKNENTYSFGSNIIEFVNYSIFNLCLISYVESDFLEEYFAFCASIINSHLGSRVITSTLGTLAVISKYFKYLKIMNNISSSEINSLINCACSVISILGESKYTESRFTSVIGEPTNFRRELSTLLLHLYSVTIEDFKRIFYLLIETIIHIIAFEIREIDEIDTNEQLTDIPFAAYQLATVILNNVQLRKYFSMNLVDIFASNAYKNDCVILLSAISYIYTLSFQINKIKSEVLEPVVQVLYTILMNQDTNAPLGDNCTVNNRTADRGTSILETSSFSQNNMNLKQKGRDILIATAKQLHITLTQ
ncbi:uncharacterized protein LOC126899015 isoform X2 [Daktulosphaira vitifoliae]|uniref:uncharacterized protein LOC126899015 isoform X2 n=1 Tax=Daktulosphaira vitifoliae TaxID=58002 RepID=UPI0021A9B958|nr:uncharacterized protein LOC126899015 isoform X2 [Daktulosphaira vitifoliae]